MWCFRVVRSGPSDEYLEHCVLRVTAGLSNFRLSNGFLAPYDDIHPSPCLLLDDVIVCSEGGNPRTIYTSVVANPEHVVFIP